MQIPYKLNPFRQNLGWDRLPQILKKVGYRSEEHFLFSDKYQAASLLSFYSSGQKRAYFFNLSGSRKNQFSYWPQMSQQERGKAGYFVVLENVKENDLGWFEKHYQEKLSPYFESIQFVGGFSLFEAYGVPVKYAIIFKGNHYLGKPAPETSKY